MACGLIPQIYLGSDFFNYESRNQMPGPGMMRRWDGQMPGPMMSDDWSPPPEVTPAPTATPGGSASVSFGQDIYPIFERECIMCHGGQAGLYLDSYDHLMAGSPSSSVVVPGDPSASELVSRIMGINQPGMPLGDESLNSSEIDAIVTWITEGSPNN